LLENGVLKIIPGCVSLNKEEYQKKVCFKLPQKKHPHQLYPFTHKRLLWQFEYGLSEWFAKKRLTTRA